ncbi:MAG: polyribonucleotide nucleotidyltransferase [Candidatus Omnitrophota bacterium]|jgi:polyribonucleotide nucleotidyltransferase
METKENRIEIGDETLIAKNGHIARQAHGSVTLQYGETVLLVAVCTAKDIREGQDFFPLTVEYQEKAYAGGTIPGGFFKREGRANEKEILVSRLTDRPIRPLFPKQYLNEVQIVAQVLSSDGINDPDVLSINGASIALMLSDAPFLGPVGAVRVAEVDGQFVINPSYEKLATATLDLVVAGTRDGVTMIESEADQISEARIIEALKHGHEAIIKIIDFQLEFVKGISRDSIVVEEPVVNQALVEAIRKVAVPAFAEINQPKSKEVRDADIKALNKKLIAELVVDDCGFGASAVKEIVHDIESETVRNLMLDDKKRVDGRALDEIRDINCEIGFLPRTHGSAVFTRGQTQSLGVVTLGTSRDEQIIESYQGRSNRHFMLHYNFPPYSVGEARMMRGPGRREIGHGALAWRGLHGVLPSKEEFPYTIRLVSEILESNGSSSMASICAGSLALLDAGVPIKASVSGIAMGLVKDGERWSVLSDIAGVEDHLGDMDFKVAGTTAGITTLQLDIKLKEGLDFTILEKALEQANQGRIHILSKMTPVINAPKEELSPYAPRIKHIKVNPEKISEIIGPGGRMIRKISSESGAEVEIGDDGTVKIIARDQVAGDKAIALIQEISKEAKVGQEYTATVKRIMPFGAFCEILPGKDGLLHISEVSHEYISSIDEAVKIGDVLKVKVIEIDAQGRVNLSAKVLMEAPEGGAATPPKKSFAKDGGRNAQRKDQSSERAQR